MATTKAVVTQQHLTDIADAIRTKGGTTDTLLPSEMAAAIEAIPTGGDEKHNIVLPDYYPDLYGKLKEANERHPGYSCIVVLFNPNMSLWYWSAPWASQGEGFIEFSDGRIVTGNANLTFGEKSFESHIIYCFRKDGIFNNFSLVSQQTNNIIILAVIGDANATIPSSCSLAAPYIDCYMSYARQDYNNPMAQQIGGGANDEMIWYGGSSVDNYNRVTRLPRTFEVKAGENYLNSFTNILEIPRILRVTKSFSFANLRLVTNRNCVAVFDADGNCPDTSADQSWDYGFINNLPAEHDEGATITLRSWLKNLFTTEEQTAIETCLTNKGWTLAW